MYSKSLVILAAISAALAQTTLGVVSQISDGQVQETTGEAVAATTTLVADYDESTITEDVASSATGLGDHENSTSTEEEEEETNTTIPDGKTSENAANANWKYGTIGSIAALGAALLI